MFLNPDVCCSFSELHDFVRNIPVARNDTSLSIPSEILLFEFYHLTPAGGRAIYAGPQTKQGLE